MIGACSVTRLISTHPLMRKLEAIRQAGTVAQDIVVAPLTGEDLGQLICGFSSLRTGAQHPPPATDPPQDGGQSIFRYPVQVRTRGRRPTHFQSWRRVMVLGRESHSRARGSTDNVVDLMVGKLSRLLVDTHNVLQLLAAPRQQCGIRDVANDLPGFRGEHAQPALGSGPRSRNWRIRQRNLG